MKRITEANGQYYLEQKFGDVWAVIAFLGDAEDLARVAVICPFLGV